MSLLDTATKPLRQAIGLGGRAAGQGLTLVKGLTGQHQEPQDQQQAPAAQRPAPPKDLDDVTIARKVETELFRSRTVEKGKIDVNVVDGKVFLRGTAKTPAQIRSLEAKALAIPEVAAVENLLHLPKTPARTAKPAKTPRTEPRRLNADKTVEVNEDLPEVLAEQGKPRQPAKLGSKDAPA